MLRRENGKLKLQVKSMHKADHSKKKNNGYNTKSNFFVVERDIPAKEENAKPNTNLSKPISFEKDYLLNAQRFERAIQEWENSYIKT